MVLIKVMKGFLCSHLETTSVNEHKKGRDINKEEQAALLPLISWGFVQGLKKNISHLHFKM